MTLTDSLPQRSQAEPRPSVPAVGLGTVIQSMVPSPALGETSGMPQPEKAFQKNAQMSQAQERTAGPAGIVTRLLSVPIYKAAATGLISVVIVP